MKHLKKMLVAALTFVFALAIAVPAFAQTKALDPASPDGATITVSNAANGETYTLYKLFDATVNADGTSVAYQGTIPAALGDYFEESPAGSGYVKVKDAAKGADGKLTAAAVTAIKNWATSSATELVHETSNGEELVFSGLPFGYYVLTSTQDNGTNITVDSTNPNATVIDKNTTVPVKEPSKTVDDQKVNIGQTVTYTISFGTANYDGEDQIDKYIIEDTLPNYLSDVTVTSIIVDADGNTATTDDQQTVTKQFTDKKIEITWAENGKNLYKNGSKIIITYTAKVTDAIAAGNVELNKNEVTITPKAGEKTVTTTTNTASAIIKTFAAALQKVDGSDKPLAGASFQVNGLVVTGEPGNYTVVSYDKTATTAGTTMLCDNNGKIIIRGIADDEVLKAYEVAAPNGYNKINTATDLTPVVTSETTTTTTSTGSTTKYFDSEGKEVSSFTEDGYYTTTATNTYNDDVVWANIAKVVNQQGTELPSTGGIGTTIFYIVGGLMLVGGAIALVTKKRVA